ncbi:hypothetical protein [Streptomyces sp. NPDC001296]
MSTVCEANAAPTRRRGGPQALNVVAGGIEIHPGHASSAWGPASVGTPS